MAAVCCSFSFVSLEWEWVMGNTYSRLKLDSMPSHIRTASSSASCCAVMLLRLSERVCRSIATWLIDGLFLRSSLSSSENPSGFSQNWRWKSWYNLNNES